ncbi:hypothetical protein [Mariprofundus sp. EBB-1]|uniref:hypothetical protein n=1 Tax=Mariprofundus sp. EBB-1 TaxID=2650971 RepID=UPI001F43010A|nr:hypothetical protein [Mariprofundus sp. EBB-1]
MAIERIYYREHNFVLTLIYGKLSNAELAEHVIKMHQENEKESALTELADCRYLTDVSELNVNGIVLSASMEKDHPRTFNGLGAIVVAHDADHIYGLARAYAAIASQARIDSHVYRSLDEAIDWLAVNHLKDEIVHACERVA